MGRFQFAKHCDAVRRYLLLGQGDFVQALMDLVSCKWWAHACYLFEARSVLLLAGQLCAGADGLGGLQVVGARVLCS